MGFQDTQAQAHSDTVWPVTREILSRRLGASCGKLRVILRTRAPMPNIDGPLGDASSVRSWHPDELWVKFIAYCGERPPTMDLTREFAAAIAKQTDRSTKEIRAARVMLILQGRLLLHNSGEH
jgi:hypothetical protein